MNNTKWDELRLAMYGLNELHPKWRTKDMETGYISEWDGEWFYHFRAGGYEAIEWVDIRITCREQETVVLEALRAIHIPGERTDEGFRVFGHIRLGQKVDYIV